MNDWMTEWMNEWSLCVVFGPTFIKNLKLNVMQFREKNKCKIAREQIWHLLSMGMIYFITLQLPALFNPTIQCIFIGHILYVFIREHQ